MNPSNPTTRKDVLPRQAASRAAITTLLMIVVIALLAFWLQLTAMNRTAHQVMTSLERFYADKLILLDQEWQEQAIRLHNRLELLDLFAHGVGAWDELTTSLRQESGASFAAVVITDEARQVLHVHPSHFAGLPEALEFTGSSGWHVSPTTGALHRWIAQPFWLGPIGHGELIVLVAIENGLLFRASLPFTELFVLHEGRVMASSQGNTALAPESLLDATFWNKNQRIDQIAIPWRKNEPGTPRLVIRHLTESLFSVDELLIAGVTLFALISWLFWKSLGSWMIRITRRINTLGWVAEAFSKGLDLTPEIRDALHAVRDKSHDEVTMVADAIALAQEVVARELRARLEAQADLSRMSSRNQLLLEAAGEGIYGLDTTGRTTFINPAAARMIGWLPEEIIGTSLHDRVHHTHADQSPYPRHECRIFAAIRSGTTQVVNDELFWRKDGSAFPVEYTSTPIRDQGEIRGAVVVFRDISERLRAEKQARDYLTFQRVINGLHEISYHRVPLNELLDQALAFILSVPWLAIQAKGAIFVNDPQTDTLRLSAQLGLDEHLLTLCAQVAHGRCLCGRVALSRQPLHADRVDERHEITFPEMPDHGHYAVPILSGERLLGVLTLYLAHGQSRNPEEELLLMAMCQTLGSMIERKRLEESLQYQNSFLEEKVRERTAELHDHLAALKSAQNQLIQSERLAALGGLVAGISHEIKTPVGTSFTAVTYLESELNKFLAHYRGGTLFREDLDAFLENVGEASRLIQANLRRASDLILSFKQVAVDQTSQEKRRFDLKEYLDETVFTLRPKLKNAPHRVSVLCPEGIVLYTFPGALSQIVANFILNSLAHAFGPDQAGRIDIEAGLLDPATVFLHYRDNGQGMDAETVKLIYEPFFTTNRNQGGSGLGMHIVYNLVTQRLNGTIETRSTPGAGTEFRIHFPV
ncbi:MAG: PAS domain S-box protein [Magnetococcales bacterium]|nr:PAS domain S-box protein [Magnetococcales bacterium]